MTPEDRARAWSCDFLPSIDDIAELIREAIVETERAGELKYRAIDRDNTAMILEIERLREALKKIADGGSFAGPEHDGYYDLRDYARAILDNEKPPSHE